MEPSYKFDQDYETPIIGVDEVGRGPLAGPVISAAIILNKEKIPEGMDWNLWLGPCQEDVPFSRAIHPTTWRPWWSFGCGGLGDIGCHTIDTAYWALGLGAPIKWKST